jgi:hypothetical protein
MLGLNILDTDGKFKNLRTGLTPISFVKICKTAVSSDLSSVLTRKSPDLIAKTSLEEVFKFMQDRCTRLTLATESSTAIRKYVLGKIPGSGRVAAITEYEHYWELSNIMFCKIENNIEGMADSFMFTFPLMSSALTSNNSVEVLNIIRDLVYKVADTDKVQHSKTNNINSSIISRYMNSHRYIEIYLGYKEQLIGGLNTYDQTVSGMERFAGVIDTVSVNELNGYVTMIGRDLTGPLLDVKTAAGFKSTELNIQSVVRDIVKNTGYILFENLYSEQPGFNTVTNKLGVNINIDKAAVITYGAYDKDAQLMNGELAYTGKTKEMRKNEQFASACRIFYDSYSNETLSLWDVLQSAAVLTGHITYVIPGTNVIYFGIPKACNISEGYVDGLIKNIQLPVRDQSTWSITAPGNCTEFKYSAPAKIGSNVILVIGSLRGTGTYEAVAVHPSSVYSNNAEQDVFVKSLVEKIGRSASLNSGSGDNNGRGTDLTIEGSDKVIYNIIIANAKSSFTDTPELLSFSAVGAYKRILLNSVKANVSTFGCPTLKSGRSIHVKGAAILNAIFHCDDPVTMGIAEATHEYNANDGYKTTMILEKYYSDGSFSSIEKFDTDIVVTECKGIQDSIMKNIGQYGPVKRT